MATFAGALSYGLIGTIIPGAVLSAVGIGIACLFHHCPLRVRDAGEAVPVLFQFNNTHLSKGEMAQLAGLVVNITTSMEEAIISSDYFDGVKAHWFEATSDVTDAPSNKVSRGVEESAGVGLPPFIIPGILPTGIRSGKVVFPIPGLEDEKMAQGTWIMVDPSTADGKTQETFDRLYKALQKITKGEWPPALLEDVVLGGLVQMMLDAGVLAQMVAQVDDEMH